MNFACVVGARPNFMKMAPVLTLLDQEPAVTTTLIHTGQHYDRNLSEVFFDELGMKRPDVSLNVGSGPHGAQTGQILERIEEVFRTASDNHSPFDRVVVVGDVNSTMAATLAAVKLSIPVAHIEAGLRSFDRSMPEEINRLVTDSVSDMLFVSELSGVENLRQEGHADNTIHLVGNVMIDTLRNLLPVAKSRGTLDELGLVRGKYGVITMHRPSNVDDPEVFSALLDALIVTSKSIPLVFPVHPRTEQRLKDSGLQAKLETADAIHMLGPLGYLDFLALTSQSRLIVTDSGGLQEESTVLGIPCLTLRANTERPITVEQGTSTLVGSDSAILQDLLEQVLKDSYKKGVCPELWDGKAAERIVSILLN